MVAFGMFVNIAETDRRARTHVQKLVNHAGRFQICCSTANTQWRICFSEMLHKMENYLHDCITLHLYGNVTKVNFQIYYLISKCKLFF